MNIGIRDVNKFYVGDHSLLENLKTGIEKTETNDPKKGGGRSPQNISALGLTAGIISSAVEGWFNDRFASSESEFPGRSQFKELVFKDKVRGKLNEYLKSKKM